jgi:hypothetical protein
MKSIRVTGCALAVWLVASGAAAQNPVSSAPLISIEVESSRSQLVAGEGLGVVAKITNVSSSPVYLRETSLALTLPLELEGSRASVNGYSAYFPTEAHFDRPGQTYLEYYKNVIALRPGDTYSAFWTNTFSSSTDTGLPYILQQIGSQIQFLFFYPGKYSITITGKYWTDPSLPADGYRTVTKSVSLPVAAPLFVILLGAALGGLISYLILPQAKRAGGEATNRLVRVTIPLVGMSGAMLLSVIVTIMLARVSETQFLISVTVNDFWGAIVVGFAANYGGARVLERILKSDAANGAAARPGTQGAAGADPGTPGKH